LHHYFIFSLSGEQAIMLIHSVPRKFFLTRGVGVHQERLVSFELALRDARISPFNLVTVSSIIPPHCELVEIEDGLVHLSQGEIVYCILSTTDTDQPGQVIVSSIGMAIPEDLNQHGYLAEHHSIGQTETEAGAYAEKLACIMLTTAFGIPVYAGIRPGKNGGSGDTGLVRQKKGVAQSAVGQDGNWTTVVAAAVFAD
jgi:arginine decarboxylase